MFEGQVELTVTYFIHNLSRGRETDKGQNSTRFNIRSDIETLMTRDTHFSHRDKDLSLLIFGGVNSMRNFDEFVLYYLLRWIEIATDDWRVWPGWRRVHGPPEVCDLEFSSQTHQQVLRFNVSVNHLLTVTVGQCVRQLSDKLEPQNICITKMLLCLC